MQKPTDSSQSAASTDSSAGFTTPAAVRPSPPVATFRQYLEGPAEAFEVARRQARAARAQPGGAPDTNTRRLYAH
ncbi:MAG: hypothetical protein ACRYFR_08915 [Janthinobacterium lividum]